MEGNYSKMMITGGGDYADTEEEDCGGGESSSSAEKVINNNNKKKKGVAVAAPAVVVGPVCQAERCGADLSDAKRYHRRHKVCEIHSKAPFVSLAGLRQRFCQQCSRFHELSEFDEAKRSCRRRLAGHNERRRKSSVECYGEASVPKIGITSKETHHYINSGDHGTNDQRPKFHVTLPPGNSTRYNKYYMK